MVLAVDVSVSVMSVVNVITLLIEKVQQLTDMSAKKPIISLNLNRFKEFVKSSPKDYSFVVMFTAMAPSRRCAICQAVYDEFQIVTNSYRFSNAFTNKLFFGMVDFDEGSEIFQMFLYNKQMWAVAAVFFCFAMVSGQMWNQIRGPPFFHRTKNGPVYINGGSHGQFILESYIVAILIVVGMIVMIEAAGGVRGSEARSQADGKKRRFQTVVGLVLVCVFFSLLLSVFRAKTQGYPYR
ncbi:Uncharacterized protein OBRU01_14501 [Operophtera brumata]|uniref:Uncharacterized protein n=1 Tax=Operophtera brumata TaxID=104452 RepID=A0A0L7L2D3_OPEBR|nr:Uncharacterized protein OBRU01_14501 [Operophtera brumata]